MMDKAFFELNPARAVIAVGGEDRAEFLQGLISNDTKRLSEAQAIFAALLTPQGKFAYDLFLGTVGDRYLIDADAERHVDLLKRLKIFKLRSKVTLEDLHADFAVIHLFGGDTFTRLGLPAEAGAAKPLGNGIVFVDPRLPALGARAYLPRAEASKILAELGFTEAASGSFRHLRYEEGVPEGNGVDWQKGCYMGQELTARTKYRGLVRKRLLPVSFDGNTPAPGTILSLDGKEAGEIRSSDGKSGLALIRLEHLDALTGTGLDANGTRITARVPAWMKLPELA